MKKRTIGNRIQFRIIMTFILLLVPVYVLLILASLNYVRTVRSRAAAGAQNVLAIQMRQLESQMRYIDQYIYSMQRSGHYYELMDYRDSSDDTIAISRLLRQLNEEVIMLDYDAGMFMSVPKADQLLIALPNSMLQNEIIERNRSWIVDNHLPDRTLSWTLFPGEGEGTASGSAGCLVRSVGAYGLQAGAVIFLDSFITEVENGSTYIDCMAVCDDHPTREVRGYETVSVRIPDSVEIASDDTADGTAGKRYYIHLMINQQELSNEVPGTARLILYAALLSAVVIPLLMLIFKRMIVDPTRTIRHALDRLGEGQQDYRIGPMKAADEFVRLAGAYNHMADEIRDLKIEAYEQRLDKERVLREQEQMRLQNLMLQVRPHFLLNAFNQIFAMAQLKDFESVQTQCMYLSKYFRYLFNFAKSASIAQEIELVKDYLVTMQIRYPDCFEVVWDIDESLTDRRIPPFLIHNFIENIFKYAVMEGTETTIEITLKRETDGILLMIRDDGPGMQPEILEKIREGEPVDKKDGRHIGIWNAAHRLKTLGNARNSLTVESVLTEGTTVQIRMYEEEQHGNDDITVGG